MATTTNYSWTTPDDTALVKDGAAAIRSLGTAIDTTVFNNAGAAINKTIIDAKGDLIVGSAADTAARLAVGTNDHVLTADSTATNGVKWAAVPASTPTFVGCRLTKSAVQSLDNATSTAITWNTEDFDTDGFHSTVSNTSRITIPTGKDGKYLITSLIGFDENSTGTRQVLLYKNGANALHVAQFKPADNTESQLTFSTIQSLVATDYIELYAYQSSGGSLNYPRNNAVSTRAEFSVQYLGA